MSKLREIAAKINIKGQVLLEESMALHTSFQTGGPADLFALPKDREDLETLFDFIRREGVDYFVLGEGANLLVADKGFRGLVISCSGLREYSLKPPFVKASAGLPVTRLAELTGEAGLAGLHYFYSMPGTLGGALWMNARCYDHSFCEPLLRVDYLYPDGRVAEEEVRQEEFSYKASPYQKRPGIILAAEFSLSPESPEKLMEEMRTYESDRQRKGHFRAPSAGSVFKNNRLFGKPSGQIIDQAGLKGLTLGGAQVSPDHGNIIYNTGGASSADIRALIELIKKDVYGKMGFLLEEEIIYLGDWDAAEEI